jgi:prophage regulatory protein
MVKLGSIVLSAKIVFHQPVKSVRAVAFIESEVDEWIQLTIENSRKHVA